MNQLASVFGVLGAITASCLFFPQVWKSYKTKDTTSLSWNGIVVGFLNGVFWLLYGILIVDPFIYITNSLYLVGAALLLCLKYRYK